MRVAIVAIVLAACGRAHFDRVADARAASPCPDNFVWIAGDAALGTADFCVMQFEAKARSIADGTIEMTGCDATCSPNSLVTTHVPDSVPEGGPWHQIDAVGAQQRCLARGFDLISNREWMTIARQVEQVGTNWSGGVPGIGRMNEGSTDASSSSFAVTDPSDPYSDTGNSAAEPPGAGWEQRRTFELANGDVLWDFSGNLQEWVDWTLGGSVNGAPTPCTNAELPAFSCPGIVGDDFNSSTGTYDSTNGAGQVIGGSGNATRRGGQSPDLALAIAGIYALNMNRSVTDVFPGTTFRCVLRLF